MTTLIDRARLYRVIGSDGYEILQLALTAEMAIELTIGERFWEQGQDVQDVTYTAQEMTADTLEV